MHKNIIIWFKNADGNNGQVQISMNINGLKHDEIIKIALSKTTQFVRDNFTTWHICDISKFNY